MLIIIMGIYTTVKRTQPNKQIENKNAEMTAKKPYKTWKGRVKRKGLRLPFYSFILINSKEVQILEENESKW